jgi:hypothetical protein
MSSIKNITFEEIEVGATASFTTRTLSKEAIEFMALLSGEVNPFYIQEETPKVQLETNMAQAVAEPQHSCLLCSARGCQVLE